MNVWSKLWNAIQSIPVDDPFIKFPDIPHHPQKIHHDNRDTEEREK